MPKNRLIITWKDDSPNKWNNSRESLKCGSFSGAEKALSKRVKANIQFANYYDNTGTSTEVYTTPKSEEE